MARKKTKKKKQSKLRQFFRAFLTILLVFAAVIGAAFAGYLLWEKAPAQLNDAPEALNEDPDTQSAAQAMDAERLNKVYTVLLVGNDDGRGNTDTILVGRFDVGKHKVDFVSIPRDTYVNVNWKIRKINAIYAGTANSGGVAIEGLKQQIRNLTGFTVDCYAVIDLNVFIDAVDLIGGVDFDVPQAMHYEDPNQNLYIHLEPGYQHLDGKQAMGVVRYRAGYSNGDLGRVEMQQKFLKSVISQFVSLGNIPNLKGLVELLADNMDTNLSSANIAFFLRQALACRSEDINFHTLPNTPATVAGLSYTFVDLEPWLALLNEVLNPYDTPVTAENVDIVYLSNGFQCTSGELKGSWYLYS